jgi:DNA-directed RNA polymerase subunit alpha
MLTDEPQTITLKAKGVKNITAGDIEIPGQLALLNPEQHIASLTDKNASLNMEITVERGIGYVSREEIQKEKVDIGTIVLDAIFTPIKRVSYEVEKMRVGERTDFNKLRISIETDGTIAPNEALQKSIEIMIAQLKAVVGFKEEEPEEEAPKAQLTSAEEDLIKDNSGEEKKEDIEDMLKTRVETLDLSARTVNALTNANIRTVGGLARKKEKDLLEFEGLGQKGIQEIKKALSNFGIVLKE